MTEQNQSTTEEKVLAPEAQVLSVECPRCSSPRYFSGPHIPGNDRDLSTPRCHDCGYPVTTPVEPPEGVQIIDGGPADQLPQPPAVGPDNPFMGEFGLVPPTPEEAAEARAEVDRRMAAEEWENL